MSKPLKNGHDKEPAAEVENPSTVRARRYRERRKRGAIILQAELEMPMISAMAQLGWLHETEVRSKEAVVAAVGGIVFAALNAGMKPPSAGKAFVPVDTKAIQAALPWLRPGEAVTAESAGRAVGIVAKCSAQVGFGPREFGERLKAMAGIN